MLISHRPRTLIMRIVVISLLLYVREVNLRLVFTSRHAWFLDSFKYIDM